MFAAVGAGIPSFGDLSWKAPVRAVQVGAFPSQVTTAQTITRSGNGALPAVDGVTLAVGDRLLVASQTPGYVEGIYVVSAVGGVSAPWLLTRARDCDTAAEMVAGAACLIGEGTVWAGVQAIAGAAWSPTSGDADWRPNPQLTVRHTVYDWPGGTWVKSNPLATVQVTVVGAGGGGGGTATTGSTQQASGAGGGAGGAAVKWFAASQLASTETVTVGAGGGGNAGAAGDAGEASVFAPGKAYEVRATGGGGGAAGNNTSSTSRSGGGTGGIGTGGDANYRGSAGLNAMTLSGNRVPTGSGGASIFGGAMRPPLTGIGTWGDSAGSGGTGALADASTLEQDGGGGMDGQVIIDEFAIGRGTF